MLARLVYDHRAGDGGAPAPSATNPLWLVASQTDAKGQTISYQYDALDRLTSKSGPGLSVGYGYDSGTDGIGRRTSMQDGAGSASYSYDARGRLTTVVRTINGPSYQMSTTYDAQDRVLSLTFPNGDVLAYQYGDHGKPIACSLNGAPLVSSATYNALKKLTTLTLGNGLQTTWKYYGAGLDYQVSGAPNRWFGLPYQVQTGSLQNRTFTSYDLVGNPTGIAYADHTSESLSFGYNELDQLTGMSGSVAEGYASYIQGTYDIGNLLQKGAATLSYPGGGQARPHTPTSVSTLGTFGYDANGNRQTDPVGNTYAYDAENRLTGVSGAVSLQNTYDGDGARLLRTASGTSTAYVGDWYEVTNCVATAYYPFNGQPVALKQGATLSYLHRDHLGSVVAASNASGGEVASARYWPFGGLRTSTGTLPTDRLFTGQIRDLGDDRFYFFKARYYDATIGKFLQPDSVLPDAQNPQGLNRYAYALNSPMRYTDPSGHDPVPTEDPDWWKRYYQKHGHAPTLDDWKDYRFSLEHPGSGPNGTWTAQDWATFDDVKSTLKDLLREIGRPQDAASIYDEYGAMILNPADFLEQLHGIWQPGPDSTTVRWGAPPPGHPAVTNGNTITVSRSLHLDSRHWRALIAHEYTHVLQYRALGPAYWWDYSRQGVNNYASNAFELQAVHIQVLYERPSSDWLPPPWEFGDVAP